MEQFYSKESRRKMLDQIAEPHNSFRGITEATGLRILDGIYILIEMLHRDVSMEHEE